MKYWRHIPSAAICSLAVLAQPVLGAPISWKTRSQNTAPSISGTPPLTVMAQTAYTFTPVATDRERNKLTFSVWNKPAWAAFSSTTGRLSGTPSATQAGTYGNIVITVSDGKLKASLPAFAVTVVAPTASNTAPVISGTPATSVLAGSAYSFKPIASDANGDMLAFSISAKPAWATFSVSSGALTGTPTVAQVGSYAGITITVSDGKASKSLTPFAITVSSPTPTGTAALSWSAPTQNTDGSPLTNLAGYRIYHGTSASALNDVRTIAVAGTTSYEFTALPSGMHYFAISAYNASGVESAVSQVGSKSIP